MFISSSSRKASSAVISAPPIRGMPNSSFSAIAVPITSARSQAMIAASQASHSRKFDRPRIAGAAGLREIAVGGDAEPRGQRLQQDRHQVRQQDDRQQRVAELRTAGEVGRPVAGVHVADRDQIAGAEKGQQPARTNGRRRGRRWSRSPRAGCAGAGRGIRTPAGGGWSGIRQGLGGQIGRSGIHPGKMADIRSYCNSFATASSRMSSGAA